jgi:hypothetical protein
MDRGEDFMQRRTMLAAVPLCIGVFAVSLVPLAGATSNKSAIALAREALITRADFPTGWTTSSSGGNSNSNLGANQIATCLKVPATVIKYNPPTANSPTFNLSNEGLVINDSASVFPNKKIASEQFGIWGSSRSSACMATVFNTASMKATFDRELGGGGKIGHVTVAKLAALQMANETTGMEIFMPFTYKGKSYTMAIAMVIIMSTSKQEGAQLVFDTVLGVPFPASLISHLEAVTAQRLG